MEVQMGSYPLTTDLHSFATNIHMSKKRARSPSPAGDNAFERAGKRVSLGRDLFIATGAGNEDLARGGVWHSTRTPFNVSTANIQSDVVSPFGQSQLMEDADMAMDEPMPSITPRTTDLQPFQGTSTYLPNQTIPQSFLSAATTPLLAITSAELPPHLPVAPYPPSINLEPPTPQVGPEYSAQAAFVVVNGGRPTRRATVPPPKTPSMGPRMDCELCRMRVPGHAMHFN